MSNDAHALLTTLSVDVTHKIIRHETALQFIKELLHNNNEEMTNQQFQGSFVYCEHSNKTYLVEGMRVVASIKHIKLLTGTRE